MGTNDEISTNVNSYNFTTAYDFFTGSTPQGYGTGFECGFYAGYQYGTATNGQGWLYFT
jgi:hypothetical protein